MQTMQGTRSPGDPILVSIAFHEVRETVAAGWALIYHENSNSNLADLLTEVLPVEKRRRLIMTSGIG